MWFTLPLDVFWKHEMGERHWTLLRLIAHTFVTQWAVFFLTLLAFPSQLVPARGHSQIREAIALFGFILLMWIFGLANLREIRERKKAGLQWHTHYWGKPRFLPDEPIVHYLVIPLGSAVIAIIFYGLFPPLGVYLFIMAAAQFVDATDTYRTQKVERLNRMDREIQMEVKTAELENRHRGPLDVVRLAAPSRQIRSPEQNASFRERWNKVLKSSDSEKA